MAHHFGFALGSTFGSALQTIAAQQPDEFTNWTARLAVLPYETPQMPLLDAYRSAPERFAQTALEWLLGDDRRMELGEQQFETRRLIRDILPHLPGEQVVRLEKRVLNHWYLPRALVRGLRDVQWLQLSGLEQWRLLRAIERETAFAGWSTALA
jgi:hypothetical protein